jgi:hypothetical protein
LISETIPIVTPTHKETLSEIEIRRLNLTLKSNPKSPHIFVIPNGMSCTNLLSVFPNSLIVSKPSYYFTSVNAYNSLMLSSEFYMDYQSYEYILLAQTDAFVVRDIASLPNLGFPYIGASWNPSFILTPIGWRIFVNRKFPRSIKSHELEGGNGGLSLRNIKVMLDVLHRGAELRESRSFMQENIRRINEDLAISYLCNIFGYKMPDRDTLDKIFVETNSSETYAGDLVFGFHGLNKHNSILEEELLLYYEKVNN